MAPAKIARLTDRGVIAVTGPDALSWLDNLVTNDLGRLTAPSDAVHAALLNPQGKILFEFFVVRGEDGLLLETAADRVEGLVKRLSMYKLRANVAVADVSAAYVCLTLWGKEACSSGETRGTTSFCDPRHLELGRRILAEARFATDIAAASNGCDAASADYDAHRVACGVPEGGKDYLLGDTFPHEANFDRLNGVSFTKGCYVGQEVVARMQHKTVVRKRVVRVQGDGGLVSGMEVHIGEAVVGRVGTVAGHKALALIRLDRATEAEDKGQVLRAGDRVLKVEPDDLKAYRTALANRPAEPDLPR
jgi:hypothetical protein